MKNFPIQKLEEIQKDVKDLINEIRQGYLNNSKLNERIKESLEPKVKALRYELTYDNS